ncbi:MAG: FG-GAP-like repeat-containing protein [Candidatus Methylomirabilales bacterium]
MAARPQGGGVAPVVTSIAPATGSFLGGARVTVTGKNFKEGATLSIGGVDAQGVVLNSTTIMGTTGLHDPGPVNVVVTARDGQSTMLKDAFTYTDQDPVGGPVGLPPRIIRIRPASAPVAGGTVVAITGENFVAGTTVTFGGATASMVTVVSPTTIEAITPAHSEGRVDVMVINPGGQSATLFSGFRYFRYRARSSRRADRGSGVPIFTEVGASAGVAFKHFRDDFLMPLGGGAAAGDYDNDGLLDLFVTNSHGLNALYRNNGNGTFTDVAATAGVAGPLPSAHGAGWGDYDNDGDLDLFVAAYGGSRLFRNEGPPKFTFTDVTHAAGVGDPDPTFRTTGVAWGDYNMDGFLDLLVVRHLDESNPEVFTRVLRDLSTAVRPLALYRNNGNGTFTDVSSLLGNAKIYPSNVKGAGFKPGFLDYDNDGDPDIYVVNDFGAGNYPNVLWRNDGSDGAGGWTFTDVSVAANADVTIFGMGLGVGDYDNDGDLDLYMTNIGDSRLLRNRGNGTFEDRTETAGVGRGTIPDEEFVDNRNVGWGAMFLDCNNDGLQDLYMVAGFLDSDPEINLTEQPNALFLNRGDGTFADISDDSGADDDGAGREAVVADFNDDGRLDLYLVNIGTKAVNPGIARLFLNNLANAGNWLAVKPVGTTSNRDGIGARVALTAGGVTRIGEMGASQAHVSHSVVPVHFGLGTATEADVVVIRWPSGIVQTLNNVAANQVLTVAEPAEGQANLSGLN